MTFSSKAREILNEPHEDALNTIIKAIDAELKAFNISAILKKETTRHNTRLHLNFDWYRTVSTPEKMAPTLTNGITLEEGININGSTNYYNSSRFDAYLCDYLDAPWLSIDQKIEYISIGLYKLKKYVPKSRIQILHSQMKKALKNWYLKDHIRRLMETATCAGAFAATYVVTLALVNQKMLPRLNLARII